MARHVFTIGLTLSITLALAPLGYAVQPATKVLPVTTKGVLSIPDVDKLRDQWNQTQLGAMVNDPLMKPFVEDLKRQLQSKLNEAGMKLGLTWEDLADVYSGEVCIALIQPNGDPKLHALAVLVDASGRDEQVKELLSKIHRNLVAKGGKRSTKQVDGCEIVSYTCPPAKGELHERHGHFFVFESQFVATNHLATSEQILKNLRPVADSATDESPKTLADVMAFKMAMQRCEEASSGLQPHLRWFVEPCGYAQAARAMDGGTRKKGLDMVKILSAEGFSAVQGMGGIVSLATGEQEILHRSFVYAPPVVRGETDTNTDRYDLAARMLDFPNSNNLMPQSWIPPNVATYMTFNWKMKEAFEYSKTLVDRIADAEVFEEVLASIKNDPNGPRVDLRKDLVAYFAERATLLTDFRLPITTKSERLMFAIEVKDPAKVAQAIEKAMKYDHNAKPRVIEGHTVWEIVNEEEPHIGLEIKGADDPGGFDFGGLEGEDKGKEDKPILPNSAITVIQIGPELGQLIIASHVDQIVDVIQQRSGKTHLANTPDYKRIADMLTQIGADTDSFRMFSRTDHAYRPTYELIRQGKMPEAETVLGRLLNAMLGPDEEGVLRHQQIDGTKMPPFEKVAHYFGPAGMFVRSLDDGWISGGCLLVNTAEETPANPTLNSARVQEQDDSETR